MGYFDSFRNSLEQPPLFAKSIKKARKLLLKQVALVFLTIRRLLGLRQAVTSVCTDLEWDGLLNSKWTTLEHVSRLLEPFACYTQLATTSSPTFSAVIPTIKELRLHLQEVNDVKEQ